MVAKAPDVRLSGALRGGPVSGGEPVDLPGVDPAHGLTDAEAVARRARGLGHHVSPATGRTYREIVRQNLFTFINTTLFVIGAILIAMGL